MESVILMILAFIILVVLNVSIAFAMGSATILALFIDGNVPLMMVPQKMKTHPQKRSSPVLTWCPQWTGCNPLLCFCSFSSWPSS